MKTFLVKHDNSILPCYGIEECGYHLCAIVKNYEPTKNDCLIRDTDFFRVEFASNAELENSLLNNNLPFGEVKNMYGELYPTAEQVKQKLNSDDYFTAIINKIINFINDNKVVPLHEIAYESLIEQYKKIMNEETND